MLRSSWGNVLTSVPQSSTTGRVRDGCTPAQRVARTSLAKDIKIEPTPVRSSEFAAA